MTTGRKVIFVLFCCLSLAPLLWAAPSYTLESIRFLPPEYRVGDRVELRITIRIPGDVALETPSTLPELSWIEFHAVELVREGDITEMRIIFTSFQPGLKTLPSLDLGGVKLEPIKIHTISMLDNDPPPFQEPAGQMALPGTVFLSALIIALVLILTILALTVGPKAVRGVHTMLSRRREKRPIERFRKVIAELEKSEFEGDPFYSTLISELRLYLSRRTGIAFQAATAGEFGDFFLQVVPDDGMAGGLSLILDRGDTVKFGGKAVTGNECKEALHTAEAAASRVEELMLHHDDAARKRKGRR